MRVWIAGNFCDLASEGQQNGLEWTTSPFSETHFVRWENMFQFSPSKALQRNSDKILTAVIPIWPQPKVKQDLVWPSLPSWIYHRNTRTIKLQYFTESFRSFDAGLGNSDRTRNRNRNRCIIGDKRTNATDVTFSAFWGLRGGWECRGLSLRSSFDKNEICDKK